MSHAGTGTLMMLIRETITQRSFGSRIGTRHAEPFFTHETLGFSGLDQLIGGTGASVEMETPDMSQPKQ